MKKTFLVLCMLIISGFAHAADSVGDGMMLDARAPDFTGWRKHFFGDKEAHEYADKLTWTFALSEGSRARLRRGLSVAKRTAEGAGMVIIATSVTCATYSSYAATQIPEITENATWWEQAQ